MREETYLPFSKDELERHFVAGFENHFKRYKESVENYNKFKDPKSRKPLPLSESRRQRQIERDEKFWTLTALKKIFDRDRIAQFHHFVQLLATGFGECPPLAGLKSWQDCLSGPLELFFEVDLSSPLNYMRWLDENLPRQHFIDYVLEAARNRHRQGLERSSRADALLINPANGFAVLFEAKVLSDISVDTTYNARRNQLARLIDVMLEQPRPRAHPPLPQRDPEKTLLVLLTPMVFKEDYQSRLYGWLFHDYRSNPEALARDLPHRNGVDWKAVSQRLAWITWEDCERILPGACPWLHKKAAEVNTAT